MKFLSLGLKDPLEEEMSNHSSILTWKIPWTEGPGGLQSMGSQRVRHDLATDNFTSPQHLYRAFLVAQWPMDAGDKMWVQSHQEDPLEKEMAIYSSILAWEFLWTEEPGGMQSTGSQRVGHVQFSSVAQSCPTLCDPMNHSTAGLPVHHRLPESTQTHVIELVMPYNHLILYRPLLLLPSIFPSISLFKWVSSSYQVAQGLEFQLQHRSFQWTPRTDLL